MLIKKEYNVTLQIAKQIYTAMQEEYKRLYDKTFGLGFIQKLK